MWEHLAQRWHDEITLHRQVLLVNSFGHSFPDFFIFWVFVGFRCLQVFKEFYGFTKSLKIENLFRDQIHSWMKAKVVNTFNTPNCPRYAQH